MKKFLCGMIALLMCVSAAGCAKNGGEVQTVTCLAETEKPQAAKRCLWERFADFKIKTRKAVLL